MRSISVNSLVIEVTRRCNMNCEHCLRGEQEDIDLKLDYVETLFKKINYIFSITFTGGEPSLVPYIISSIIKIAKKYNVDFGSFYIATNGKNISNKFLYTIVDLWLYCIDNELSMIYVSSDDYHESYSENFNKFKMFSFTEIESNNNRKEENIIPEGNALNWGNGNPLSKEEFIIDRNSGIIKEGVLYLNCEGYVIGGCDWSYKSQRKPNNIISHVDEFSLDKVEKFNS